MSLENAASDLMKVANQAEEIAVKLYTQAKASPERTAAKAKPAKRGSKKTAQPTAADTVFKVIARLKKGAEMAAIKQETRYDNKKIQNIVYKLKKLGRQWKTG